MEINKCFIIKLIIIIIQISVLKFIKKDICIFPILTMNNGNKIPQIGLGTFRIKDTQPILEALKMGYRHLDTAHFYNNEKEVGEAILRSGIKREEIFVTSKIWPTEFDHAEKALNDMFKRINLSYIDLVLLHWPYGDYISAWKVLEKFVKEGKIKNIGLSNFYGEDLKKILDICTIKPVVDQVECHLLKNKFELKKILEKENILLVAWSPLKNIKNKLKENKEIDEISKKYNKDIFQIVLRWHIQNGNIPIPKSSSVEHMKSNFDIFDFKLTSNEMELLNNFPQKIGGDPNERTKKWVLSHGPKED